MTDPSYIYYRGLPDGRYICVCPLTFGRARISTGKGWFLEDGW